MVKTEKAWCRGTAEWWLYSTQGITKNIYVTQIMPEVANDDVAALSESDMKRAQEDVSPPFTADYTKYLAAQRKADVLLIEAGRKLLQQNPNTLFEAMDFAERVRKGNGAVRNFDKMQIDENGKLLNTDLKVQDGPLFESLLKTPVIPLFMKLPGYNPVSESMSREEQQRVTAENIFAILRSNRVTVTNGKHVEWDETTKESHIKAIQRAVAEGRPIIAENYYTFSRMALPLTGGVESMPAISEWRFLYQLAQVSKTIEAVYPAGLKWLHVEEANAFKHIWDIQDAELQPFQQEIKRMISAMGIDDYIIFDDLQSRIESGGEKVAEIIKEKYQATIITLNEWRTSGLTWDEFTANYSQIDKRVKGWISDMLGMQASRERLYNPLLWHSQMSAQDLLMVYRNNMPEIIKIEGELTPDQDLIREEVYWHALESGAYMNAVMDSRPHMPKIVNSDIATAVTTKKNKLCIHSGKPNGALFPGQGNGITEYPSTSEFGSENLANGDVVVYRYVDLASRYDAQTGMPIYKAIRDPETGRIYNYILDTQAV